MTGSEMLNIMLNQYKYFIALSTPITGNAVISGVNLVSPHQAIFLTYSEQEDEYPRLSMLQDKLEKDHDNSVGLSNLAFVDPWHTYKSSLDALHLIEKKMSDNSFIFVHDCFPPYSEYIEEDFLPGSWCGVTFAAFRDCALTSNREWVTVMDDFGVGILGPRSNTSKVLESGLDSSWSSMSIKQKIAAYVATPVAVMRGVQAKDFVEIIKSLQEGKDILGFIDFNSKMVIPPNNLLFQRDQAVRQRNEAIQQRDQVLQSKSWRYTQLLRNIVRLVVKN